VTIDFYAGVLGMRLIHAMKVPPGISRGNPPFEELRHYFFDMGNDNMLAFFELPKGEKGQVDRDGVAAMQHVSFSTTPVEAEKLVERLDAAGIKRAGPLQAAPGCWSIYFFDPHGVRLEVSYQPAQGDTQQNVEHFRQTRAQMLGELRTVSHDGAWLDRVTMHLAD
jgi:catechol 2,3-dioxygenase-like lactoylglutathione lyase family enzyme